MIKSVRLTRKAQKDLAKVPQFIFDKFTFWVNAINQVGLEKTKKIKGFRDEALKGKRKGQRSIRLNKAYRAIYRIENNHIKFVEVLEVNKHEY